MPNWNELNPAGGEWNAMAPRPTASTETPPVGVSGVPQSAIHQIIGRQVIINVPEGKTLHVTFEDVSEPYAEDEESAEYGYAGFLPE